MATNFTYSIPTLGNSNVTESQKITDALTAIKTGAVVKVISTDTAIAKFDGTDGSIKNSGITIDSSNKVSGMTTLFINGTDDGSGAKLQVNGKVTSNKTDVEVSNYEAFNGTASTAKSRLSNWADATVLNTNKKYNGGHSFDDTTKHWLSFYSSVSPTVAEFSFNYGNPNSSTENIIAKIDKNGLKVTNLAGTGNRAVYSDTNGTLTNSSSDERVKINVKSISSEINVLDKLKELRGIKYNWNNEIEGYENMGDQTEIGVIAQEIEKVLPEIVGENSTGYKSVDYAKITAYLIEVNKALLTRIEILEKNKQL